MRKRKTTRKWREIVRRRQDKKAAEQKKQRLSRFDRRRKAFATMKWRLKVIRDYQGRKASFKEHIAAKQTAERFGMSVSSVRRWNKSYRDYGKRGLLDKVSYPVGRTSTISFEIVSVVILLRTLLNWGAIRIAVELKNKGICHMSHQTVHRLFKKYHIQTKTYHPKGKSNGIRYRRYRKRAPHLLWHIDLTGPFSIADQKVYLLVVIDDYSRFALTVEIMDSQETSKVTGVLEHLFSQYGSPKEILTDNGTTFTSVWATGSHPFDEFCLSHGVTHQLTPPYYPESNGKAEAFIKTVKRECLVNFDLSTVATVRMQQELQKFRDYYNFHRLHSGLGYDVPSSSFCGLRLKPTLAAIPQLEMIALPHSPEPEEVPQIDRDFIHCHTALVTI